MTLIKVSMQLAEYDAGHFGQNRNFLCVLLSLLTNVSYAWL